MSPEQPPEEAPNWIDVVVGFATAIGFNGVRLRWRLLRIEQAIQRFGHQTEQKLLHVRYEHTVCPRCGRVQDRTETRCVGCHERLESRAWQILSRLGLVAPSMFSVSTLLGVAMLVTYYKLMRAPGAGGYFDVDTEVLIRLGAYWLPAVRAGELWRHATAVFLHIGLIHLGFNLLALAEIGPAVEEVFGRGRMLFLFMLTGVVGFVACQLVEMQAPSAGASGAIMGLIGTAAGWGQRDGTTIGRELRNRMLKWAVYTMMFGWVMHANNVAHGAGFAAGALFGLVMRPRWRRSNSRMVDTIAGFLGFIALITTVVLILHR